MSERDESREPRVLGESNDVTVVLAEQHTRLRRLFHEVSETRGPDRATLFDELRALLAVHAAGEALLRNLAGPQRNAPSDAERLADRLLGELESHPLDSAEFDETLGLLEVVVMRQSDREESEGFPWLRQQYSQQRRLVLGGWLRLSERLARPRTPAGDRSSVPSQGGPPFAETS